MPIINLIQEQRIAEQKTDQRTRIAGYTFLITIGFGVMGSGIIFFQKSACQAKITRLTSEIEANKPIMKQIEAIQHTEDVMKPRLTTLGEAQKVTNKWTDILAKLQTQTPQDTWLTGLQCPSVSDDKPIMLTFTGTGKAQEPISEFILRSQNEQYLNNVALHFTQEKRTLGGIKQIDFEVGAEITDSAVAPVTAKEDTKL